MFSVEAGRIRRPRKGGWSSGCACASSASSQRLVARPSPPGSRRDAWRRPPGGTDDERDGVVAVGLADRSWAAAGGMGNVEVAARRAIRDRAQRPPYALPVCGACRGERQVEHRQFAIEICVELVARAVQQRRLGLLAAPAPIDGDNRPILLANGEVADRGMERKLRHGGEWQRPVAAAVKGGGRQGNRVNRRIPVIATPAKAWRRPGSNLHPVTHCDGDCAHAPGRVAGCLEPAADSGADRVRADICEVTLGLGR